MKKIFLISDHAGFDLKQKLKTYLIDQKKYEIIDLGPSDNQKISYSSQGQKLAQEILKNKDSIGIGICGTGIGISIAVNRFNGVRGARVTSVKDAILAKKHNDANILLFGGRQIKPKKAFKMFLAFDENNFEGERHISRIKQLDEREQNE